LNQEAVARSEQSNQQQIGAQPSQPISIYDKYIGTRLLQVLNITDSSASFAVSSNQGEGWQNARVTFNGQTIINEDGNSVNRIFSLQNGILVSDFEGSEEIRATLCQFCTNWVSIYNLIPNTEYNYQILYGTDIYSGKFKTL